MLNKIALTSILVLSSLGAHASSDSGNQHVYAYVYDGTYCASTETPLPEMEALFDKAPDLDCTKIAHYIQIKDGLANKTFAERWLSEQISAVGYDVKHQIYAYLDSDLGYCASSKHALDVHPGDHVSSCEALSDYAEIHDALVGDKQ